MIRKEHWEEWVKGSAVNADITELNVQSITGPEAIRKLKWNGGTLSDGWWVGDTFGQFKPDKPPVIQGKHVKYLSPSKSKSEAIFLKMPDENYWDKILADQSIPVIITEGCKKAGAGLSLGWATIALTGVWNGQRDKIMLVPNLTPICVDRVVYLAFDSDIKEKPNVKQALDNLAALLYDSGCQVRVWHWDISDGKGLDDLIINIGSDVLSSLDYTVWAPPEKKQTKKEQKSTYAQLSDHLEQEYAKRLEWDVVANDLRLDSESISMYAIRSKVCKELGLDFNKEVFEGLVKDFALKNRYNPVKQYLEGLKAPNCGAIAQMAQKFDFATQLEYRYLRMTLIAAVARAMEPGCKVDTMFVLYSKEQGRRKSSSIEVLGGKWSIALQGDENPKDEKLICHSSWLVESAELEYAHSKKAIAQIKNNLSIREDMFRAPYDPKPLLYPRQFIYIGTTNESGFLGDSTGSRRFWVAEVRQTMDIPWLIQNRDSIWIEALEAYKAGEKWWFDEDEAHLVEAANEEYQELSPYFEEIAFALKSMPEPFSTGQLMSKLELPAHMRVRRTEQIFANDLKLLGYSKTRRTVFGVKSYFWTKV